MCGLCHTEIDSGGVYRDDHYLAGGMRVGALPQGVFVSRNLTSDPDTGLGRASVSQIADAIRNGRGVDGRTLNFWGMPWMYLHRLSGDDAAAIATYLKTLPPQRNAIPDPLHCGFVETIARKLAAGQFPVAPPAVLTYSAGSYANQSSPAPDRVQNWLISGQWAALFLALAGCHSLRPEAAACRRPFGAGSPSRLHFPESPPASPSAGSSMRRRPSVSCRLIALPTARRDRFPPRTLLRSRPKGRPW